tara:strand:+ start:832 stop:1785 length:954 start_codon:yes stop_codon:yes gene_type:complete
MQNSVSSFKIKKKESFVCFCNKIEHKTVKKLIIENPSSNLNKICLIGNLANKCAACIPNIEELYFSLRNSNNSDDFIFKKDKIRVSLKKYILQSIDHIMGYSITNLNGFLPMLDGKTIDTYLVMSNHHPKNTNFKSADFILIVKIFNREGKKITSFEKKVKTNKHLNLRLNKYIIKTDQIIEPYYVQVTRKATSKGYRGSTRIHFFYKTLSSMASLHVQDGAKKLIKLELMRSNSRERKFIFLMNTGTKFTRFSYFYDKNDHIHGKGVIAAKGCELLETNNFYNSNYDTINIKSKEPIKAYFIISDKKFNKLSVDHL